MRLFRTGRSLRGMGARSRDRVTFLEPVETRLLLASFMVTSAVDDGSGTNPGSLSWAITEVNSDSGPGADTIDFNIPGTGPFTINPSSILPSLSHPAFINGGSQPGYSGTPMIQIQGPGISSGVYGLKLAAGSDGSTVSGLCVSGFGNGAAIQIESDGNLVERNYLGTDITGDVPQPNQTGILIENASGNMVGGTNTPDVGGKLVLTSGNLISGNSSSGVWLHGTSLNNVLEGNFIGVDPSGKHVYAPVANGSSSLGNLIGVLIGPGASNNTIGGPNQLSPDGTGPLRGGNLISGNSSAGVEINGSGSSGTTFGNVVKGNFIGSDLSGATTLDDERPMGNGTGVLILGGASNNLVGGSDSSARNLISGNVQSGVEIGGINTIKNTVVGNYIGTDSSGTRGGFVGSLGNGSGVLIDSEANLNTVGGTNESGGGGQFRLSLGNLISGNLIGVDINGAGGGFTNNVSGQPGNTVEGNLVGTDFSGKRALANGAGVPIGNGIGVQIEGQASFNTVGALTSGARNIISGNTTAGILIIGNAAMPTLNTASNKYNGASFNVIEGNYVGTDVDGGSPVSNGTGVLIVSGAGGNSVGGTTADAQASRNIISGNIRGGVEILGFIASGTGAAPPDFSNSIAGNFIGLDRTGTMAIGNSIGVLISNVPGNLIESNVISGNSSTGVQVSGSGSTREVIFGNLVGPDAYGNNAVPPSTIDDPTNSVQQTGILIDGSIGNAIGQPGKPMNVISGNRVGLEFTGIIGGSSGPTNFVSGNYIGIGKDKNTLGNVIGVLVNDSSQTQIGLPGAPNFIAGNTQAGIYISGRDASGNVVQSNVIGLGPDGQPHNQSSGKDPTNPFPIGIYIQGSSSNLIGGAGKGNTISGNNVGVYIVGTGGSATNNQILGNRIGPSLSGRATRGNEFYGVIFVNAPNNKAPQSGRGVNRIVDSGIANFREFSGAVTKTTRATSSNGSSLKKDKLVHHSNHAVHQSPRHKSHHAQVTAHGHMVPAGPLRKRLR
jgi:hypothetical protein